MNAIQSRARLAEPAAAAPLARPALPIRRSAAEEALRDGDGPVELTFDVVRVGGGTEAISMILERPDLERTLQSADGEELALVFDPQELAHAMQRPDVEAQGLRETAAVLTVAVAAMAGSAGVASAAAGGASGTGYVVPAGSSVAIVNDAGAAGASGPAMSSQRVARRRSSTTLAQQAPAVPAMSFRPAATKRSSTTPARQAPAVPAMSFRPAATKRSSTTPVRQVQAAPAMSCLRVARRRSSTTPSRQVPAARAMSSRPAATKRSSTTPARQVQAAPAMSCLRVARRRLSTMERAPHRLPEATRRCRQQTPRQSGPARSSSSPAPPSRRRGRGGARTCPTSLLRSVGLGARRPPSPRTKCSSGSEGSSAAMRR